MAEGTVMASLRNRPGKRQLHFLHAHASRENVGDDALVIAVQKLLAQQFPDSDITYTCIATDNRSRDGEGITHFIQLNILHRLSNIGKLLRAFLRADGVVIGGGELICGAVDYLLLPPLAAAFGIPVGFVGIGAESNAMTKLSRWYTRLSLRFADAISVRDPEASRVLEALGVSPQKVFNAGDLAFSLYNQSSPPITNDSPRKGIGICLRSAQRSDRTLSVERIKHLACSLQRFAQATQTPIVLFPFIPSAADETDTYKQTPWPGTFVPYSDEAIMNCLRQCLGDEIDVRIVPPLTHPDDIMREFAQLELVIAMRLHALILAMLTGTPIMGLDYANKIPRVIERATGQRTERVFPMEVLDSEVDTLAAIERCKALGPVLNQQQLEENAALSRNSIEAFSVFLTRRRARRIRRWFGLVPAVLVLAFHAVVYQLFAFKMPQVINKLKKYGAASSKSG